MINRPPDLGTIKFLTGPLAGSTCQISKPITTIGRDANNDIIISDPAVSRQHARLVWSNGTWSIERLTLHNSISVNQRDIQQATIQDRDTIVLGTGTTFMFFSGPGAQQLRSPGSGEIARPMSAPMPPAYNPAPGAPPVYNPAAPVPPAYNPAPMPPPAYSPTPNPVPVGFYTEAAVPLAPAMPEQGPGGTRIAKEGLGIPSLEISNNIDRQVESKLLSKNVISIGRDPSNDIVINQRIISSFHAQIVREGNQLVLIHPHPQARGGRTVNGLIYQGRQIRGDEQFRKPLTRGDIFRIGDEHGSLVTLTYNDGSGQSQEYAPEIRPIPLGAAELTIGRSPDNTVVLSHPQVSGHHARLVRDQGTYQIMDLGSTNHVYVNGQRVTRQPLRLGDEIRIGPFRLTYNGNELTQFNETNYIRIDALNLKKYGNEKITLIDDISLVIPPRKFVALVGGSGAGKSTLMDALNGLRPAQQGKVLYNGQDYYQNLAAFSTQLGYVPQDDIVHRDLTVERALYYAAKMRLPSDFTDDQIERRIQEVLEDVEITERRKLLVSKLSGGQRKRVSIALELLANPAIFFLDEPTSGLDPGLDRKMMFLLRKLADKGHTIILVTHATNNINACDYVCFLVRGGRLAFFGPPQDAKIYFEKDDFAEIYSSLEPTQENPHIPEEAERKFRASRYFQEYVLRPLSDRANVARANGHIPQKRAKRGNPFKQFFLLSLRYLELLKNDSANLTTLLLQAPLIALVLMLLVKFEIGNGVFDASKVVQCPAGSKIVTSAPIDLNNPSKGTKLVIDAIPPDQATDAQKSCDRVLNFLKTGKNGSATDPNGPAYAKQHGGPDKALQDFIPPGTGSNAQTVLFFMAFTTVLFGCINGSLVIVKEAPIYRRERTVNLGIMPYMFSKIVVLGALALLQSGVLLLITNAFEPFHQGVLLPILLEAYITLALTSLAGLMVGLMVSAFAPNTDRASSLVPIILIPQVFFAGAIIPLKDWVIQIPAVLFPSRWAMVGLGSSIGLHAEKIGGDKLFGSDDSFHGTLFSTFTQTDATHRILLSWGALGAIIVLLIVVMAIALKRKDVRA